MDPVLEKAVADHPEDPRAATLNLRVLDPACGSGHFLLVSARRMATNIARLESYYGTLDETVRQHALREVPSATSCRPSTSCSRGNNLR